MEQYNQRTAAPDARGSSAQGAGSKCVKCATNPIVLKLINVINGALILLVGVLYWLSIPQNPTRSIQAALIGTYSIACGIIFLVFSIGFGKIDTCNRKNCGFVYTFYGRFLFVIFAGSLCFGLPDPQQTSADAKAAGGMLSSSVCRQPDGFRCRGGRRGETRHRPRIRTSGISRKTCNRHHRQL